MQNALMYAATVLIWGSTWYMVKLQLGVVDPIVSVAYRFAIASVVLFGLIAITQGVRSLAMTRIQIFYAGLMGLFIFCLNYIFLYVGTLYIASGLVSICFSLIVIMNIFNQAIFLGIPIKRRVLAGGAMGLAGITLVFWHEVAGAEIKTATILGVALCLVGTYSSSLGNIISSRNSKAAMPIMQTNCIGMAFGAVFSLIIALASGAPINFDPSFTYIWTLLYLAIFGSIVAFWCYLSLIARLGADRAAYCSVLFPIVALTISTFFENYVWTVPAAAGLCLVVAGNVLVLAKPGILGRK